MSGFRLLEQKSFIPEDFAALDVSGALPPGAVPELAYARMQALYQATPDVVVSEMAYASDGLCVTGLMALPAEVGRKMYPIVIYNRGGNREYGRLTLYTVMQMLVPLARAGYLVFASNYRGNAGGEGREEFGGADVNDVLNLLELARLHSGWDGKNAFMVGHSRGGMMTYRSIREGAQLNAAVSIAGVADLFDSVERRPEMGPGVYRQLIAGEGGAYEEAFRARSAVCWPEALTVPLLLLHGDADDKVDVSDSMRLAEGLREAGNPHELVIYPGGNHALTRHWGDVQKRMLGWFEGYKYD